MTPAARVQAAIDLLDEIIAAARDGGAAADTLIARYFKARRYAGSKDRRAVRDLLYRAIRRCGDRPASGRAAMLGLAADDPALAALFDGSPHGPAPIGAEEERAPASLLPGWIAPHLPACIDADEQAALLGRAPLDLRVNRLKADAAQMRSAFPDAETFPAIPDALRLPEGGAVERSPAWRDGLVEIQDIGSQIIAMASGARPGMTVIDLCAGAGGKTLALAAMMEGRGRLIAADINRDRLARLPERAARAGAGFVEPLLLDAGREAEALAPLHGAADAVLVDAPCSGTGTWRRNPEARWRLTPQRLTRICRDQAHILDFAAALVKPGGRLAYAVCSIADDEGRAQIDTFLQRHSGWTVERPPLPLGREHGYGRLLTPAHDGTDGFFIATLLRS
ncbi:16S rRNA (cytosine967-C5)-methyltransferase [Sphingobium jiangsuense]|uniref:16S rRNA (Cytosine967-C5)-methyltransferase n=1 Tax=Sphingobium jiangsuense TaxID=870476 RepID=A0A7W6BI64_9SPHN|nr:RsmB/NOP family class I SAM-dependent RNA methyltransferase [Sphingobium jiangsuense]MBB3926434.1 16S rRNA (cytosine967-C5)-methyltransferase [Sphingobium jiangsuense]